MSRKDVPKIFVAMPAYNAERDLARSVESIREQTFTDFEFLIVDDGPTDGTRAVLEKYAARDDRIRLISRANTGLLVARNAMLELARGEHVARMDADDIAFPERFERQARYLDERPELDHRRNIRPIGVRRKWGWWALLSGHVKVAPG